eukprot:8968603-Pyramimonas_sp.AAC.1
MEHPRQPGVGAVIGTSDTSLPLLTDCVCVSELACKVDDEVTKAKGRPPARYSWCRRCRRRIRWGPTGCATRAPRPTRPAWSARGFT